MVLTTSFSSALEMRLAGLRAVGYGQEARSFLLARSVPSVYGGPALVAYWDLACRFLGISKHRHARSGCGWEPPTWHRPTRCCAPWCPQGFVVICPFAGGTFEKLDKAWPAFPQLTRALLATDRQVVACPGPGEEILLREQYPGVISIEGVKLGAYGASCNARCCGVQRHRARAPGRRSRRAEC